MNDANLATRFDEDHRAAGAWARISTFLSSAPVCLESERPAILFGSGQKRPLQSSKREARSGARGTFFAIRAFARDSDMATFGYAFRPWNDSKAIADGPSILRYLAETAKAYRVDRHVRFGIKVVRASWRSAEASWTLDVEGPDGEKLKLSCRLPLPAARGITNTRGAICQAGPAWTGSLAPSCTRRSGRKICASTASGSL